MTTLHHTQLLLQALLLDELWTSTCQAKTVKSCIKSGIGIRCKSRIAGTSRFLSPHTAKRNHNQGRYSETVYFDSLSLP
jgi:hypothetical protein